MIAARVLRLLASVDFVNEPAENQWSANDTTHALASPPIAAGHRYDALVTSAIKAPKFLRETKYREPTEPTDTFLQYANQTKLPFFEYLQSIPPLLNNFNLFMGHTMGAREYWHEWYDIERRLLDNFDSSHSSALLVDVGGGKGHDLNAFDAAFGKSPRSYEGQLMGHDFFLEQPAKGARGYFLHHVLHDWSDKYCLLILQNLRTAMVPGYSKLLIHELILPNNGATEIQARFDLVMMTLGGGMERSKTQWTNLLEDAGFCNIVFHEHFDHDGIVEAEASENTVPFTG
ncbi:S-adenosyl-L-methionine-dependent methyltransferase [Lophiotrema nucula]|uniref:S-adenosyl-L-methionine-dependent methyltransferase n=1 Tax=Lophiotrema nucula TaxID=690887 RepID=A0A6A5ZAI3_9PLEO|nr:S-adenosyl-L-methionine-dependent methyltransferase [Lophiotrema nucula]